MQRPSNGLECGRSSTLAEIVAFLASPEAHGGVPVEVRENSMSWVFLTPDRVYKLKKPIRRPPLDFATLGRRQHFCAEEVRLNARLARETYLDLATVRGNAHRLSLDGAGRIMDWLVVMVRLPDEAMLSS